MGLAKCRIALPSCLLLLLCSPLDPGGRVTLSTSVLCCFLSLFLILLLQPFSWPLTRYIDFCILAREGSCLTLQTSSLCYSSAEVIIAWVNFKPICSEAKTGHPATDDIICVTDDSIFSGAWNLSQNDWVSPGPVAYGSLRLKAFSLYGLLCRLRCVLLHSGVCQSWTELGAESGTRRTGMLVCT